MTPLLSALIATLAAQGLASMAAGTAPVLAPVATADLGVSTDFLGLYVAVMWSMAAVVGLTCGSFVTRFGAIRVTQIGLVLAGVGMVVTAGGTIPAVLIGGIFVGLSLGTMTPASSHVLARVTPPHAMNFVFSAKQTGVPLGAGIAGLLMPALTVAYSWQLASLVSGLLCLALAVALQPLREQFDGDRDPHRRLFATLQFVAPLRMVFGHSALRRMIIISFIYVGMQNCFSTFFVSYLHERLEMSLVTAGFVFTVGQVAGAVGRITWAALADRYFEAQRMLGGLGIAMAVCAVATASFAISWPLALMLAVSVAFGGTSIAWNGVYLAQVAIHAPPGRIGDATGASAFCTFVGVVLFPSLFSVVLALSGSYALGFCLMGVCTAVAGLWLLLTSPTPTTGKA